MENDPFDLTSDEAPLMPSPSQAPLQGAGAGGSISERARQAAHDNRTASLLDELNEEQRTAVMADNGPLLLLAGAGTGKTRALTTRIAYKIVTQQAWPSQILAVTFTNKAAREMKQRIAQMLGETVEGMPWLGTFHALSARILRQHAELVDLRPDFTILDTDDQIRLLKQLIQAENIDEKRWPARQMAGLIDRWKNRGWSPDDVPDSESGFFGDGLGGKIYGDYQKRLKALNAVDFGDLLLESLRLFRENEAVVQEYQQRFQHIFVDEYQDTNVVQYLWLRLLAQAHNNICCVGDDDQSIYGWRGAEVDNILRFEKDFTGAKVIRLEHNYRSTPHILGAASGLIAANEGRLGKTLWTHRKDGDKVNVRGAWDGEEEARLTANDIETSQRSGQMLNEMAVLVRASFQMREFEDRFISLGIPYRVIGGPRFYERAEIRDANAYLRLIAQIDDDLAFERICNKPRRGLGNVALQTLHDAARHNDISMFRAACELIETEELKPAARRALSGFVQAVARWRGLAENMPHTELAELILDESGYTAMWQADKSPDAPGKLENLKELIRSMEEFETLGGYLEHIALVMEAQNNDKEDKVSIMTLHAAKGLEFETVFLPGWEEGLFPHQRSLDESGTKGLEEERRLAYVGITRAKQRATISFVGNRRTHGQWVCALPSRFIDELPPGHVEIANHDAGGFTSQSRFANDFNTARYTRSGWQRASLKSSKSSANQQHLRPGQPPIIGGRATPSASHMQVHGYKRGERIFHQKFGYGRIEIIDGNKLTVAFEKAGTKKVLDSYVEKP